MGDRRWKERKTKRKNEELKSVREGRKELEG